MSDATIQLLLAIADDKLMLGHRNSDWTGLGPILEEDIAFSALAQGDIAHAQALYEHVAKLTGSNADQIAFGRTPDAYRCAAIVETHDDFDWAYALARQFYCAHCDAVRFARLSESNDTTLAALAKLAMWPPSSDDSRFACTTIAIAFQRMIERMRCSSAWSPGLFCSRFSGIVLM